MNTGGTSQQPHIISTAMKNAYVVSVKSKGSTNNSLGQKDLDAVFSTMIAIVH